ncbi:hypothetical protein PT974_10936 [Cladobotryum mycophilum]|uniref:Uncharacterized protein n=1 Tax=Cladobotryum mycophilum TaxID=491253 RepID=A0ABR0SC62_9HYPO
MVQIVLSSAITNASQCASIITDESQCQDAYILAFSIFDRRARPLKIQPLPRLLNAVFAKVDIVLGRKTLTGLVSISQYPSFGPPALSVQVYFDLQELTTDLQVQQLRIGFGIQGVQLSRIPDDA